MINIRYKGLRFYGVMIDYEITVKCLAFALAHRVSLELVEHSRYIIQLYSCQRMILSLAKAMGLLYFSREVLNC